MVPVLARLADRFSQIQPSATLVITAKARALQAQGVDVCSFGAGEPDFDTPAHIRDAAKRALDQGKTRYGPAAGEPALRRAISHKLQQDNDLTYSPDQILVTNGGKQAIYNLTQVLLNPGDEMIIPAPYWVSYPEMARLAGAVPVIVPAGAAEGYKLTPDLLRAALTPRSQLVALNSPNNPTGAVYSREELAALAEVIVAAGLWVISDEIYEKLIYDGSEHVSIAALGPEIFERTLVCSGFAKAYAMTGWRVGYVAGPKPIIDAAITLEGHSTSNVCTFAQYGALAALEGPQDEVEQMRQVFGQRRDAMLEHLRHIPGLYACQPQGAFYVFIDIRETGLDSQIFCERLLDEFKVAAVPGAAFGDDHHIRLSYATDLATIERGMDRLATFVQGLA